MNRTESTAPDRAKPVTQLRLALSLVVYLVAATLPYVWLIEHFGYDDVLREPPGTILLKFHAGGAPLVLAWLAFAISALLFIPVALGFSRLAGTHSGERGALTLGVASAIAQAIGLLRWVLVVPGLAACYASSADSGGEPVRQAVLVVFDAAHRYGGMVIGELLGQLLLAGWTAMVAAQLWRSGVVPRWLAAFGALTLPFWLLGQTELLHQVVPSIPSIEVVPIAFMAWGAWLVALAVALLIGALRRPGTRAAAGPA